MTNQLNTRLLSLDAFRGFTVAAMLMVNNPGDWGAIYKPLEHADWNGCTFADLIFPFFLFISGVSITYALGSKKENHEEHPQLIKRIIKRSIILFGLGIVLAFIPYIFQDPVKAIQTFRIPGILQRIALVYFSCAFIFLKTNWKQQLGIFMALLVGYWAIMMLVAVPGHGAPNLEKETNIGAWIDRLILSENHLWIYSKTWDPEGILGTLPSIATGISGLLTGAWLRNQNIPIGKRIIYISVAGIVLILLGKLLEPTFPINKSLWTSTFVLYTSGFAMMVFTAFYWTIDMKGYKTWSIPLLTYGTNAITAFFTSMLAAKILNVIRVTKADGTGTNLKGWIYESFYNPYFSAYNASFAFSASFVLVWLALLWWMYSRKIIIKI